MKTDLIAFSCERLIISLLSSCQNREHHVLGIFGEKNQETVGDRIFDTGSRKTISRMKYKAPIQMIAYIYSQLLSI